MIRREPTLIPMTDSDVQDVRDAVKLRTKAVTGGLDTVTKVGESVPGYAAQEEAQRKKEGMSKNERLGLA
jgi:hypothetical protein